MQIPESVINEVRERADIVEVVSRFVDLRRAGVNYKSVCPFHEEKTPSFVVSPDKQIFHCFGCGRGGNVFSFLMEIEGVSFPESVRALGKQYGITVPDRSTPDQQPSQNEMLYRVMDFAARFYARQLTSKVGTGARKYLEARGIGEEAWKKFQLGYAGDSWDAFIKAAQAKRVPIEPMMQLKLIAKSDRSKGYYDYFRSRVMFPIALMSGRVVGFGARTMQKDVEPKYLNSVESPIYHKRKILYGLSAARQAIRKARNVYLVEGYTDCISLHGGGFENTVASCGTALTADHAALLRRVARSVTLVPDADSAGREAALFSGSIFLAAGLDVKVALLDKGTDPDGALRALGGADFGKKLSGALEYFEYLNYSMRDTAMTPNRKEAVIQRITSGLGSTGNRLRYEVFMQEMAKVLGVDPESLPRYRQPRETPPEGTGSGRTKPDPHRIGLEKLLLRLLLESTPEAAMAREKLHSDDFSQEKLRKFYNLLDSAWENHIDIRSNEFQQRAEKEDLEGLAAEISLIPIPPGNPGILLNDTVKRVKELQIRNELSVLRGKLRELPAEGEEAVAVAEHYARLKRALDEL
jgi:DNA primase